MPLPVAAAAKGATVAAPIARQAAQSDWTPLVVGLGLVLAWKVFGDFKEDLESLINKPVELAGDLLEGTGDFFQGAFTGATRTETPVTAVRDTAQPETIFALTAPTNDAPTFVLGNPETFDPNSPTVVVLDIVGGEPVMTVTNANVAVPLASYSVIGPEPSLAQRIGAAVFYDPITGLYTDPVLNFGELTVIPSIQDQASGFVDTPIIGFRGEGFGPTLGDVGSFIKGLF